MLRFHSFFGVVSLTPHSFGIVSFVLPVLRDTCTHFRVTCYCHSPMSVVRPLRYISRDGDEGTNFPNNNTLIHPSVILSFALFYAVAVVFCIW